MIDHVYTNNPDLYPVSAVIDPGVRAHSMTYCVRRRAKIKHETRYITGRSYRQFNDDQYRRDIEKLPWTMINLILDVDDAANLFTNMILDVANFHTP